jgi:type IV pilus assembly protein PilM
VKLYYKDKPILGLDISQTGVKIMAIDSKKMLVSGYGSMELDPIKMDESIEKNGDYFQQSLTELTSKNILGLLPSDHAILSIPTSRTFTRTFTLPIDAENHLKQAIELEIDQYIPLPAETLHIDYEVVDRTKESLTICLSAAPRTLIDRYVEIVESIGLRVISIEPGINAVARLLENTEEGHLPTVIVDIGPASTDIAILDGSIRVTGSTTIGGNTFTLDIAKKLNVPLDNAHQLKILNGLSSGPRQQKLKSALSPSLQRILSETRKVIRYYNERLETKGKLEQVLIVGGGSNLPGIGEFFTDELVMPARVASPWQKLNFGKLQEPPKQFKSRYITVAGLALVHPEEIWK